MFNKKNRGDGDGPLTLPLLSLRDVIVFPTMMVPLFVGREKSINALNASTSSGRSLFLVAQKKAKVQDPEQDDLFLVGTICTVIHPLRLPDGTFKVLVEGKQRAQIRQFVRTK